MTTKVKKLEPYTEENMSLANEVKRLAEDWVDRTFNFIQLHVYEKMCENEGSLLKHIESEEITWEDIADYNGHYGDKKWIKTQQKEYPEIEDHPSYDDVRNQHEQDNYPMWNTLFEFKNDPGEQTIQAARNAGFGIISGMDDFNTTLFVSGAGYSFYGQHWIPLFLNLPWNENLKKKYAHVNLQGV